MRRSRIRDPDAEPLDRLIKVRFSRRQLRAPDLAGSGGRDIARRRPSGSEYVFSRRGRLGRVADSKVVRLEVCRPCDVGRVAAEFRRRQCVSGASFDDLDVVVQETVLVLGGAGGSFLGTLALRRVSFDVYVDAR